MVKCSACDGDLRKLEYTWKDNNTLHKKTICNDCGMINEWDKYYPDPTMANKRFYHVKKTRKLTKIRGIGKMVDGVLVIKDVKECGCSK